MEKISSAFCPPSSKAAFEEAQRYLPGGVNSPVRAFKAVGGTPLFVKKASDARLYDLDGNSYVDYIGSWGPMILGHAHPEPVEAIRKVLENGVSFGAPTLLETQLAKLIVEAFPSIEQVRMVNSGTEATMSAIRLARGVTGREKVVKFEGCYHGHGDSFLIAAGSGALTMGTPNSPGLVRGNAAATLVARYNDLAQVETLFEANRGEIAAVIIEPVAGNMGTIAAEATFLQGLRWLTKDAGALLIFDEVMTGFRLAWGGAQTVYGVEPDLTCLGKIIGGGVPVGAYGGRREWMEHISPLGKVYQAGTLSGNPLGMAAGGATLNYLKKHPTVYQRLEEKGAFLEDGLRELLQQSNQPAVINRVGSMLTVFFTTLPAVNNFETAKTTDTKKYAAFFQALLKEGVYFPPSAFEALFLSLSHSESELSFTLAAARKALRSL